MKFGHGKDLVTLMQVNTRIRGDGDGIEEMNYSFIYNYEWIPEGVFSVTLDGVPYIDVSKATRPTHPPPIVPTMRFSRSTSAALLASATATYLSFRLLQWRARKRARRTVDRVKEMTKEGSLVRFLSPWTRLCVRSTSLDRI